MHSKKAFILCLLYQKIMKLLTILSDIYIDMGSWRTAFHTVPKYSPGAKRPFYPKGPKLALRTFQDILRVQEKKIRISHKILKDYGLSERVWLGKKKLSEYLSEHGDLATYLYDNYIHPRFFAVALHLIATKSKELAPSLAKVQLLNLNRSSIANAIKKHQIKAGGIGEGGDIGQYFEVFAPIPKGSKEKSPEVKSYREKLEILEKLGVLIFQEAKKATPAIKPPIKIEPKPPIKRIDPHKKTAIKKKQLDLFNGSKPKKA